MFQLTLRRCKSVQYLEGLSAEQKADVEKYIYPEPGSKQGSDIISSDETDEEDGEKVFLAHDLPGRSEQLQGIMYALDECAKKQPCAQLFKRYRGRSRSGRSLPDGLPAWMVEQYVPEENVAEEHMAEENVADEHAAEENAAE